jgi:hypothetical protein
MTIETRIETASSAKARGFRYVRSDEVASVSVIGERSAPSDSLRAALQACFAEFDVFLRAWLSALPQARVILFTATPPSAQHNAVSRRRGIWRADELRWLPDSAYRSPSVEIAAEDGWTRFAGLVEIPREGVLDAVDFVRMHSGSFLLVSSLGELTEERVRATVAQVFPTGESDIDWESAVAQAEGGEDICVRATGTFDDREASIDAFLHAALYQKLEVVRRS